MQSNIISLSVYRDIKAQVQPVNKAYNDYNSNYNNSSNNYSSYRDQATNKQLWELYKATKINTSNLIISMGKASELINKSKQGQNIKQELISFIRSQDEQLMAY
jgi:hypothetical protein